MYFPQNPDDPLSTQKFQELGHAYRRLTGNGKEYPGNLNLHKYDATWLIKTVPWAYVRLAALFVCALVLNCKVLTSKLIKVEFTCKLELT